MGKEKTAEMILAIQRTKANERNARHRRRRKERGYKMLNVPIKEEYFDEVKELIKEYCLRKNGGVGVQLQPQQMSLNDLRFEKKINPRVQGDTKEKIRRLLAEGVLKQNEIAAEVGVSQMTVSRLKRGAD